MNSEHPITRVHTFIKDHDLITPDSRIIVGLSGGPDSIFLLHVLKQLHLYGDIKLIAAHLDHEWRQDSYKDIEFCKNVAQDLQIPFVTTKAHEISLETKKYKGSQEALGRAIRRTFLQQVKKQYNADFIALAHHLDDQEETFFIRLIRGTSLSGLCAMHPRNGAYIRPLLDITKSVICSYLQEQHIPYLEDPTNMLPDFLRNRIRATVIPALRSVDKRFDNNFLSTITRLQDIDAYLTQHTIELFKQISSHQDNRLIINIPKLLALPSIIQDRLYMYWLIQEGVPFVPTTKFLQEIRTFLQKSPQKIHAIHHAWHINKSQYSAYITKNPN